MEVAAAHRGEAFGDGMMLIAIEKVDDAVHCFGIVLRIGDYSFSGEIGISCVAKVEVGVA